MPASSSKDPYLLYVLRGSFWPFGGLFPPAFSLGLFVFFQLGRAAAGFNNSAACTHAPATFTFVARALRLGTVALDLAPLVGTRGSELDLDPAPGVKVWCLGEALGPAPGDPELLSACNADSHSARASVEAGPDFPEEAWVPSIPSRDRQKQVQQNGQSALECQKKPR